MPLDSQLVRRLTEMIEAIDGVQAIIGRQSSEEIGRRLASVWAIERGFEIISEASRSIPVDIKSLYADIPWQKIARVGNILRHRYWTTDMDTLWETALWDLPVLKSALEDILRHDGEAT